MVPWTGAALRQIITRVTWYLSVRAQSSYTPRARVALLRVVSGASNALYCLWR
jgi:hypothetical protein